MPKTPTKPFSPMEPRPGAGLNEVGDVRWKHSLADLLQALASIARTYDEKLKEGK